jgi:hypothetical protein
MESNKEFSSARPACVPCCHGRAVAGVERMEEHVFLMLRADGGANFFDCIFLPGHGGRLDVLVYDQGNICVDGFIALIMND